MSKRNIEKHILMNKAEAQDLQKKAKRAWRSDGGLISLLLKGYEPREKPDERFYDVMRELSSIGNNINQIARSVNAGIARPEDAKQGLYLLRQVYELLYRVVEG